MDSLFGDGTIQVIAGIVAAALSGVLGLIFKSVAAKAAAEKVVDALIPVAFHIVEDVAAKTPNKIDDKVALGLKYLVDLLATKNVEPTEAQVNRAKLVFQALHAQSKAAK